MALARGPFFFCFLFFLVGHAHKHNPQATGTAPPTRTTHRQQAWGGSRPHARHTTSCVNHFLVESFFIFFNFLFDRTLDLGYCRSISFICEFIAEHNYKLSGKDPASHPALCGSLRLGSDPWSIDTRDYSVATLMDLGSEY